MSTMRTIDTEDTEDAIPDPPPVAVFDLETTGLDINHDRIITAYLGILDSDGIIRSSERWLVNPGVHIPAEATKVHGFTDERVVHGKPPTQAVREIVEHLEDLVDAGYPIVAFNASYDFTILHREAFRHFDHGVAHRLEVIYEDEIAVLDPFVIDKALDQFRPGSRKLAAVAAHYGLTVPADLHDSSVDAVLAGRLMLTLWRDPRIAGFPAGYLHERQIAHYRQQAESFRDYLHRETRHEEALAVRNTWPYHPIGGA